MKGRTKREGKEDEEETRMRENRWRLKNLIMDILSDSGQNAGQTALKQ
jgi:hypothetical protein